MGTGPAVHGDAAIGAQLRADIATVLSSVQAGTDMIEAAAGALQDIVERARFIGALSGDIIAAARTHGGNGDQQLSDAMLHIDLSFNANATLLQHTDDTINALRCLAISATLVAGRLGIELDTER